MIYHQKNYKNNNINKIFYKKNIKFEKKNFQYNQTKRLNAKNRINYQSKKFTKTLFDKKDRLNRKLKKIKSFRRILNLEKKTKFLISFSDIWWFSEKKRAELRTKLLEIRVFPTELVIDEEPSNFSNLSKKKTLQDEKIARFLDQHPLIIKKKIEELFFTGEQYDPELKKFSEFFDDKNKNKAFKEAKRLINLGDTNKKFAEYSTKNLEKQHLEKKKIIIEEREQWIENYLYKEYLLKKKKKRIQLRTKYLSNQPLQKEQLPKKPSILWQPERRNPWWRSQKRRHWLNIFAKIIYHEQKEWKFDVTFFRRSQWLLSSRKAVFNKPAYYRYNSFKYFLLPSRYVYSINDNWTPYYLAIFNLKYFFNKKINKKHFHQTLLVNKLLFYQNKYNKTPEIGIISVVKKFSVIEKIYDKKEKKFVKIKKPNKIKKWNFNQTWKQNRLFFFKMNFRHSWKLTAEKKNDIFVPWYNRWQYRRYRLNYFNLNQKKRFFQNANKKLFNFPSINSKNFLNKKKLKNLKFNLVKKTHRFGFSSNNRSLFFLYFLQYMVIHQKNQKKEDLRNRKVIPYTFRHTQENPWRYYNLSRWDNKANSWLNPVMYNRKLFIYHLLHCITKQKRHPNRYKRFKIYKLFMQSMNNRWTHGIRAKKNYRLRQIMFERIVLPAVDYLKKKQFMFIKKNVSHVKTLGLINSRSGMFLGKFERRIDILTYKLNFAPTIQWARNFVKSGLIYVSYVTLNKTRDYRFILNKNQKFPLFNSWKTETINYFNNNINYYFNKRKTSHLSHKFFNMPLPVTLPANLVQLTAIIHWNLQNTKTIFYKKLFKRHLPKYFIYNKKQTTAYFWRNLRNIDIDKVKFDRIRKNTMKWLL